MALIKNHSHTTNIDPHDLPFWMRQATRGLDWGLLLAVAFALIAAWPFVLQAGLPRTNANENYVFMAQDFSDALREGRLYPRWSPHVFGGYGAPIPNYYPPGAPYITAIIKTLFTNDVVLAARIVYVITYLLAGASLYLFVSRRSNAAAALLAVILYLYSPYFANTSPHTLGDLSGMIALALLPTMLYALDRLLTLNQPQDLLFTALSITGLTLTHVTTTIVGLALALVLMIYHIWLRGRGVPWLAGIASLLLGVGLAAFFWIPAVAEQDLVTWQPQVVRYHPLTSLNTLFQPVQPIDLAELVPTPQIKLGLPLIGFTLAGLLTILSIRKCVSFYLIFLLSGAGFIAVGIIAIPREISLLGVATMCLAIGASSVVNLRQYFAAPQQRLLLPIAVIIALAASIYAWLPPRWPGSFGGTQPLDQILYEQQSAGVAVLPPSASIPITISPSLATNRFLINGYQTNNINKIAPATSVSNRIINVVSHTTHGDRFQVQLDINTRLDVLTAYFPGWEAFANGIPARLSRNPQTGLIVVDAPRMVGELTVSLNPTQIQQNAWYVSFAALLLIVLMTIRRIRRRTGQRDLTDVLVQAEARLMLLVMGCFVGVIALFAAPFAPFSLYARPGYALDNAISVRSRSDTGLEALAYRLNKDHIRAGDALELTLYWQALRTLPDNYQVQIYLLDPISGVRWHRTEYTTPGGYPTRRWRTYTYVTDTYQIPLSETMIPADYQVAVEVFPCSESCDPDERLTFYNPSGISVGQTLILPAIVTVTR
jgi:hypothetical protein